MWISRQISKSVASWLLFCSLNSFRIIDSIEVVKVEIKAFSVPAKTETQVSSWCCRRQQRGRGTQAFLQTELYEGEPPFPPQDADFFNHVLKVFLVTVPRNARLKKVVRASFEQHGRTTLIVNCTTVDSLLRTSRTSGPAH